MDYFIIQNSCKTITDYPNPEIIKGKEQDSGL
jgi:hypothetical protein